MFGNMSSMGGFLQQIMGGVNKNGTSEPSSDTEAKKLDDEAEMKKREEMQNMTKDALAGLSQGSDTLAGAFQYQPTNIGNQIDQSTLNQLASNLGEQNNEDRFQRLREIYQGN